MRGYAITGERRSGSNYLCTLLKSTGVLGKPGEWFVPSVVRIMGIIDFPEDHDEIVRRIPELSATSNGIYGLKLHAVEFDQMQHTRWAERMPSLSFVYLERRDVIGQAISFARAIQTGQFTADMCAETVPTYDRELINRTLVHILSERSRWHYYFTRNDIDYLHLVYEDVVKEPQAAVEAVARLVGLAEKPRIDPAKLHLRQQRDALSQEWRARFISEMRDLARFD